MFVHKGQGLKKFGEASVRIFGEWSLSGMAVSLTRKALIYRNYNDHHLQMLLMSNALSKFVSLESCVN
jgi:hypothetical protein